MFKLIKYLFFLIIILLIGGWLFYSYQINVPVGANEQAVVFTIEQGEGVHQISADLFKQGLIKSNFWFEVYIWRQGLERNFVAGSYDLPPKINIKQLTAKMTTPGESEKNITILEGWSNKEIAKYLAESNLVKIEDFLNLTGKNLNQFVSAYDFLADKPSSADLEGYLFPDTYRVFKNASAEEIVKKMLDNFGKKLTTAMRAKIKSENKSVFEIVTLASIIEKEVRNEADMKMVADIFYKRLEAGIALQSDATINYITGKGLIQPSGADLKVNSPYNTYQHKGLTPTPISNPGLNAISAAIYPTSNPYYYFLTTKEGAVIYSKTYAEHLVNKRKYLD